MRNKIKIHRSYDDEYIDSITCDICKKTYKGEYWGRKSSLDILETSVKLRTGFQYQCEGSGEEISFDICPTCFMEKLVPALKELGAESTKEEWSCE